MSLFKRFTSKADAVKAVSSPGPSLSNRLGPAHRGSPSMPSHQTRGVMGTPRPRSGTDPQTCLEVYKSHWIQASSIINKNMTGGTPSPVKRSMQEEVEAVTRYVDQMLLLAIEEEAQEGGQGPILEYTIMEDILEKLFVWSSQRIEYSDRLKVHQLKVYELLICQARQPWVIHKPVIRPLVKLLSACKEHPNVEIEAHLILILHQLCVCIMKQAQLLELLFNAASDQGPAKFLMFSLLIPYVHREGHIGQQARDALLLIMALSSRNTIIGRYVAENSDFCPVLATGLSGLYSSLPQKWKCPSDDWSHLTNEDINRVPELVMFLNSLEFCNAVVQVAHPLVRNQLLSFIYNGFLVPVLGPALHQNDVVINDSNLSAEDDADAFFDFDDDDVGIFKLPVSLVESYFGSSMEEVITATAYLDLFIRRVTEAELMRTFLRFLLTEKYDDVYILDSLVMRINSHSRLCMVTLSLFNTLVNLNCEDIMFQLVFKYLIPCTHVMVSQRRSVKDVDLYSKTAEKLMSLTPSCCSVDFSETPPDGMGTPDSPSSTSINTTDSSYVTNTPVSPSESKSHKAKRFWFGKWSNDSSSPGSDSERSSSPDVGRSSLGASTKGDRADHTYDSQYMEYLKWAKQRLEHCSMSCQCWVIPYDGENPSPDCELGELGILGQHVSDAIDSDADLPPGDNESLSMEETEDARSTAHVTEASSSKHGVTLPPSTSHSEAVVDSGKTTRDVTTNGDRLGADDKTADACTGNYAESVTSEADSGLSASSAHVSVENPASRSDSPLNDNFDGADFNAFLLSLKRVQTPVEFCDNIEDSFNEIDSVITELKQMDIKLATQRSRHSSYKRDSANSLPDASADACGTAQQDPKPLSQVVTKATKAPKMDSREVGPTSVGVSAFAPVKHGLKQSGIAPIFTPTKYNLGTPNIGPFLSTILNKLECMMQNSLYVNLLLTGLVTRLACYPQPLLRSFLLNHTLVFQPTVKSLVQVLSSVKHKVDCYSYTVKDFDSMMIKARQFLTWRDDSQKLGSRRDSTASLPASTPKKPEQTKEKRRGNTLSDLLFRRTPNKKQVKEPRLQLLGENKGFRYINRTNSPQETPVDGLEALKTKNAVYCALVLEEFIKELSAVSQEHAVLCVGE